MEWLQNTQTGNSKWWSWWLGLVVIAVCYVVIGLLPVYVGSRTGVIVFDGSGSLMGGSANPVQFVFVLFSPIMLFVGVWLAQRLVHRRALRDLLSVGPFRWSLVWQSMAMWLSIGALSTLIQLLVYPGRYVWSFDAQAWLTIAPLVLLIIPVQAAGEELFFRGYLMQSLARLWAQPVVLSIVSGLLFMAPHLANPELGNAIGGDLPVVLNYFLFGAGTAWLCVNDNGTERAIGVHVVNNLYGGIVAGYANSALSTPTIISSNVIDAWLNVGVMTVSFAVLLWWPARATPLR